MTSPVTGANEQLTAAQAERLTTALEGIDAAPSGSIEALIDSVIRATSDSPERRACLLWLGYVGTYPTNSETMRVASALGRGDALAAQRALDVGVRNAGPGARLRTLQPAGGVVVDVTGVSAESHTTGIPRTVSSILARLGGQARALAWRAGAPGVVDVDSTGGFHADQRVWPRPLGSAPSGRLLASWARAFRRWADINPLAALGYAVARPVGRRILRAGTSTGPHEALLIRGCSVIVPEVASSDTADRLTTWHRHVPGWDLTVVVHDLLPLTHPQYFTDAHCREFLGFLPLLQEADTIVVSTEESAHSVRQVSSLTGVSNAPIRVVPFPVTAQEWPKAPVEVSDVPRFTCLGAIESRKNQATVLTAAAMLANDGLPIHLTIIGRRRELPGEWFTALRAAKRAGVRVEIVSNADDGTVKGAMTASVATIFASWAEGYGLPVLESLACGVPVVASEVPPITGFARFGGITFVSPHDPASLADQMAALVHEPGYRDRLSASIKAAELPTSYGEWVAQALGHLSVLSGGSGS